MEQPQNSRVRRCPRSVLNNSNNSNSNSNSNSKSYIIKVIVIVIIVLVLVLISIIIIVIVVSGGESLGFLQLVKYLCFVRGVRGGCILLTLLPIVRQTTIMDVEQATGCIIIMQHT